MQQAEGRGADRGQGAPLLSILFGGERGDPEYGAAESSRSAAATGRLCDRAITATQITKKRASEHQQAQKSALWWTQRVTVNGICARAKKRTTRGERHKYTLVNNVNAGTRL
ncbi:hypothetical protein NDU88_005137 [Pleurodeles waltl]|uniref:Uncharacterized protein n=1 Tax=Pleurodeles waltl TaxID=8319 RepID=A0AAV7QDV1_PLEWA|nr:hypothetical protein NDU88_005137 [Pleurodeles waltl]